MTEQNGEATSAPQPMWPKASSSIPPTAPSAWLWIGLGIAVVGAVIYLVGLNGVLEDGEESLVPAVGLLVLAFGGLFSFIGAVGFGVQLALARHEWDREQGTR